MFNGLTAHTGRPRYRWLFVLNPVEDQAVEKLGVATIEVPAKMGLALFAGGNPPPKSRKPAVGSHALSRDRTSECLAETAQMKTDAVRVCAVMIERAVHFSLVGDPTDHRGTSGAVDEILVGSGILGIAGFQIWIEEFV